MFYLEHVNINTGPWTANLEAFYFAALGFQRDPRTTDAIKKFSVINDSTAGLTWGNIGLQQFHLPWDRSQVLRGVIGLVYPSLEILAPRLRAHDVEFAVRQFYSQGLNEENELISETIFDLVCPVGNHIRIHEYAGTKLFSQSVPVWFGPNIDIPIERPATDNRSILVNFSSTGAANYYGLSSNCRLPGGLSMGLGISYIDFNVPYGTARSICVFYSYFFGIRTSIEQVRCSYSNSNLCDSVRPSPNDVVDDNRLRCTVRVGVSQQLQFTEISLSSNQIPLYDGHHIAVYVSDFNGTYNRFSGYNASNLLWNNPRFMRTAGYTLQDAIKYSEFRIKDIIDISTGEIVYELEHEIRSIKHSNFCCRECVAVH